MSSIETDGRDEHIVRMTTQTHKTKKSSGAAKPAYPRSFVYRGIKITPTGTGTSRFAQKIRKGLERQEREQQVVAIGTPA